jgi:hypothetical protein
MLSILGCSSGLKQFTLVDVTETGRSYEASELREESAFKSFVFYRVVFVDYIYKKNYELSIIREFLSDKEFAIAGVSRNTKKFGRGVYDHLIKRGYKGYPINPNTDTIGDAKCFPDVTSIPDRRD